MTRCQIRRRFRGRFVGPTWNRSRRQVCRVLVRTFSAVTFCGAFAVLSACGQEAASKVFGEQSEPCPATVLTNSIDDDKKIEDGANCFMDEFEAGRTVTWDVLVPTVEGDPIPTRYEFDGESVTITTDASHDRFGRGGVQERRCDGVRRTARLPDGIDCDSSSGDGFKSDSLPGGA